MRKQRLSFSLVPAVLLLAAGQVLAQDDGSATITLTASKYYSPLIGTPGGTVTARACPAGKIMTGIAGKKLKFVASLTPLCAALGADGSVGSSAPLEPAAIGTGGSGFRLQCGAQQAATAVRVAYAANTTTSPYLGGIEVACSARIKSMWANVAQTLATAGFTTWPQHAAVACAQMTQSVRVLRVRASTSVHAVGLVCE